MFCLFVCVQVHVCLFLTLLLQDFAKMTITVISQQKMSVCVPTIKESQPPKIHSEMLEERIWPTVQPLIQKESGFCPGRRIADKVLTLAELIRRSREVDSPVYMSFVSLEKASNLVPPSLLLEYDVPGLLLRNIQFLYNQSKLCPYPWHKVKLVHRVD